MGAFTTTETIWFNGAFVPWAGAQAHVLAHGLHYGTGVFEGIRCYATAEGPAVFRLDDHIRRLFRSASLYQMAIPYPAGQLTEATLELVRRNGLENAYIRPLAFHDAYSLDVWPKDCPVSVAIAGFPKGAYLAGGPERGVRVTVSPIRKFESAAMPADGKACGQYINSVLAVQDALRRGFDEALLLNSRGEVAEGSGENLFLVESGRIVTNDASADILMGITRETVLELASDLGIATDVRPITLDALAAADELFFTGTAVEVTPIREVDGRPVGDGTPGPITQRLQHVFQETVRGQRAEYRKWLAFARTPARVS